jgi:hypothetical protein
MSAVGASRHRTRASAWATALLIGVLAVGATSSTALAGGTKPKKTDVLFVV